METGNHDDLLRKHPNGTYAKLVQQQQQIENQEVAQGNDIAEPEP